MMIRTLVSALLLLAPAVAHADWYEGSSKHFLVYANEDPEKLRAYTKRLERFDQSLRFLTGTPDAPLSPRMRVRIFLTASSADVQALAHQSDVAGFYNAQARGPVAFVPGSDQADTTLDSQTILQHEYSHSFMYSSWPSVVFPKWFSEGFAEFFGTAFYRDGTLIIGKAPEYRSFGIGRVAAVPAERLLRLDPGDKELDTQTLYGRGWLLTHYAFLGGHVKELLQYIAAINAGKSVDEANQAFAPIDRLDGKLNAWGMRSALPTIRIEENKVQIGEIGIRKLTPGEAASMKARFWSEAGVDEKRARTVVAWARAAAAAYPNDAAAQDELAEAEYDAKDYDAAEAAADRALAADPASIHAMLYKGMAQMERAKAAKVTDPGQWRTIRSWFIKANRLDTEYPEPLILYYHSFLVEGQKPSDAAQNGMLKAYLLAPYDDDVRAEAGAVLLRQGNVPAARVAFERIAFGPHAGADTPARAILEALDKQGAEAAIKVYEAAEEKAKQHEGDKKSH
ncbi:tetratricopeptide (TPR) repeat protein [Sphingomonas trueperi]|uniref:hypothetical protein n=1 Tax=Sphingomonas trueperi TaxID=53317 RepID=UPI003399BAE5